MPNWIEGTMKVRGKAEDLIRFFENGFDAPVKKEEFDDASVLYTIEPMVYINGSRRAFTGLGRDYEIRSYIGSVQTVPVPIKQAWSFTPYEGAEQRWIDLSKKYNLDIRLEFYQDVEIIHGEMIRNDEKKYADWDLECPMPLMGG